MESYETYNKEGRIIQPPTMYTSPGCSIINLRGNFVLAILCPPALTISIVPKLELALGLYNFNRHKRVFQFLNSSSEKKELYTLKDKLNFMVFEMHFNFLKRHELTYT